MTISGNVPVWFLDNKPLMPYNPLMFLTYKYLLLPTKRQRQELDSVCEEQRQLYNGALQERNWVYEKSKKGLTLYNQFKSLVEWRNIDQEASKLPANLQRWTLRRLDNAFKAFLKGVKKDPDRWASLGIEVLSGGVPLDSRSLVGYALKIGESNSRVYHHLSRSIFIESCQKVQKSNLVYSLR